MPYLAFDLDALENCAAIAQGSGLRTEQVSHGLLMLWRHCWREKTDRITTGHLRAFFFGGDVVEMLVTFELIAATPEGPWRVRGAQKYLDISATRSANGKAAAARGNLKRGTAAPTGPSKPENLPSSAPAEPQQAPNSAPVLSASSQQPAANSQQISAGSKSPAEVLELVPAKPKKPPKPEKPPDPRHAPLVLALVEVYAETNLGARYDFTPRDAANVKALLAKSPDDEEILYRWRVALEASSNPYQSPKTRDLTALVRDWNSYPVVKGAQRQECRL